MSLAGQRSWNSSGVGTALSAIEHRGPDHSECWESADGNVQVGHVRLSIIDPTEKANQPMKSDDGRYVLVFNGEIYNYRDLWKKYLCDEQSVNSCSDTSVLFHLLITQGVDTVPLLNGMFSFVFIDTHRKRVIAARDRFGEKPLFYVNDSETFAFASELRALRVLMAGRAWALGGAALQAFFMTGSVPAPMTVFEGIFALPPGSLLIHEFGAAPSLKRYWRLAELAKDSIFEDEPPIDMVGQLLTEAVRSRMVSDVPVGVFLSGGLDSSSIVATANAHGADIDTALCIDFPEQQFSEANNARAVAETYDLNFRHDVIDRARFLNQIPAFFAAMDQPTVDGFNTFFVARAAAQTGIKVWLSGVGGDELFGGYPSFQRLGRLERLSRVLQFFVPSLFSGRAPQITTLSRAARFLHLGVKGSHTRRAYQVCRTAILPAQCEKLLEIGNSSSYEQLQQLLDEIMPEPRSGLDAFQRASLLESSLYLANQLLRDIDNFSMAESIEVRAPFLDHRLFQGVWPLPARFKAYNSTVKPLLIDSVPGGLPECVPTMSKRGFTFPMQEWIKQDLEAHFRDVVLDGRNDDIWDRGEVENLWQMYQSARIGWISIWPFFVFASWRQAQAC